MEIALCFFSYHYFLKPFVGVVDDICYVFLFVDLLVCLSVCYISTHPFLVYNFHCFIFLFDVVSLAFTN